VPDLIRDPKRILVFRIGHLGDTLVAVPAFNSIRDAFPDAEIVLLSNSDAANPGYVAARSVLPERGLFDDWIVYSKGEGIVRAGLAYAGLIRELRRRQFDALYYLMTRNRSAASVKRDRIFFRAAGITAVAGDRYLLNHLVGPGVEKPLPIVRRESEFLLDLLADSGVVASDKHSEIHIAEEEAQTADEWLSANCGADFRNKRLIAVAPGSKWDSKVWNEDKYRAVLRRLIDRCEVFPVVFGGREDRAKGERILTALGTGANAAGELNVRVGMAAMKHVLLYLGNDTGTMHMAAAVGIRCAAVFAAVDFPGRWYPFGEGHRVFRVAVECEGCHTPVCFNNHLCLESVAADEVYEACLEILKSCGRI